MKQKKRTVLDITGFFFRMSTQVKAEVFFFRMSTQVKAEVFFFRMSTQVKAEVQRNPLYPIRANSFVSIIMYPTCTIIVLLQKYMLWHIFLHFQCLESQIRQQLTKIKRQIFIGQRPFDSRLYLDIARSFKCPKSSSVVCLICYYLRSVR